MTDDAWANFIASIDPVALERERMRVLTNLDQERPGSRADHEMRHAHDWMRRHRNALTDSERSRRARELQDADADRLIWQQRLRKPNNTINDEQLEQAIAAYRARKAAA